MKYTGSFLIGWFRHYKNSRIERQDAEYKKWYWRCTHTHTHTHKHMRSDHTNMAAHFGVWWHISMPMIQLLMSRTDSTTPVWFTLGHMGHAPFFGSFSSQQGKLIVIMASLQSSTEALSSSHFTVILFLLSHVLIFTWATK